MCELIVFVRPDKPGPEYTCVCLHDVPAGFDFNAWMVEVLGWVEDPARPGRFCHGWAYHNDWPTHMVWSFTDPDVALEFRMRWS